MCALEEHYNYDLDDINVNVVLESPELGTPHQRSRALPARPHPVPLRVCGAQPHLLVQPRVELRTTS